GVPFEERRTGSAELGEDLSLQPQPLLLINDLHLQFFGTLGEVISVYARRLVRMLPVHAAIPELTEHPLIEASIPLVPLAGHLQEMAEVLDRCRRRWCA